MLNRRQFLATAGIASATMWMPGIQAAAAAVPPRKKMRLAMVGTGSRGIGMWGKPVVQTYGNDYIEFVGLCDKNPGRLAYAKQQMGVDCPTYLHTDFERMIAETKPDRLIVTTIDGTHGEYIVRGMQAGCDIIAEKPLTTDEKSAQAIIDTAAKTGRDLIATFNVRYMPTMVKIKELLMQERIGRVTSVDLNWYLDTNHGGDYMRRWHALRRNSGTLLVHKASHHFDVLNWWVASDPVEVFAYGDLEYYGKNNPYRSEKCRGCPHQAKCPFYWDITKDKSSMELYVAHEKHDGYLRDACVWREEIDIYDKMAVQFKYRNGVQVSYSLITYAPYEGLRIAFNGLKGRLEAWIQYRQPWPGQNYDEIRVTDNFGDTNLIQVPHVSGGHGGGDERLKDRIFKDPNMPDPYGQAAGLHEGVMGIAIGVAARKSIETGQVVRIADLFKLPARTGGTVGAR